ncbi:MAG: sigma-54-dependent Fis family transcriptional regulator [Deltaproteobacteria bacterium]|nr:sigma-54-dependent Fis family transcriptional regulator [Deltaproteobacteria bacterium]
MAEILVVDDEKSIREFLEIMLTKEGHAVSLASSGEEAIALCGKKTFDIVLADIKMPQGDGHSVLRHVKKTHPETTVIMITAFGSLESAVEAMREGAFDYISKPFNVSELKALLKSALEKRRLDQKRHPEERFVEDGRYDNIISTSPEMQKIFTLIPRAAGAKSNILIIGESGTGKELVARAIHRRSARKEKPFVTINCGGIPETLLESELFGYKRGSFTGATTTKKGLFEAASEGTIFLDEIGDLPLALQVKVLRVVQEKTFTPLGDTQEVNVDVRIISATNQNLEQKVIEQQFREDLYYRLNVIQIRIPPLRERSMDIPLLAQHFLEKYCREMGKEIKQISVYALAALRSYHFPGNVRELENIIERGVALETSNIILPESLALAAYKQQGNKDVNPLTMDIPPEGIDLDDIINNVERNLLLKALERSRGVKKKAAELLNLSFRSLRYRLEKLGIDAPGEE